MNRGDNKKSTSSENRDSRRGDGHNREDQYRESRHSHSTSSYAKNWRLTHRSHNRHQAHSDRKKYNHSDEIDGMHRNEYRSSRSERYKTSWNKLTSDQNSDDEWEAAVPLESIRISVRTY